jgi:hypothetical protein
VHVLVEQERHGRVRAVVEANVPDAGLLQQAGPVAVVDLLVDRPAVGLGEAQSSSCHSEPAGPLAELCGPVPVQFGDER